MDMGSSSLELQCRLSNNKVTLLSYIFLVIPFDPHTTAVSDVYQDLFREGTYTGKGLYVVDAFQMAIDDKSSGKYGFES